MGLDWNPAPKAKPGHEAEFDTLCRQIKNPLCWRRKSKTQRLQAISDTPFDTLSAPTVGIDAAATAWAMGKYPQRKDKELDEARFLDGLKGYRVLELVPACDGLPRYSNGIPGSYVEAFSFRAQFLTDCTDILDDSLLERAFHSMPSADTLAYGQALLRSAQDFADANDINLALIHLPKDPESIEFHLDVIQSAGRWCVFWAERGHGLEAYF